MRRAPLIGLAAALALAGCGTADERSDDGGSLGFRRVRTAFLSPGPPPSRPTARGAADDRAAQRIWAEWRLTRAVGPPPKIPSGAALVVVWAGRATGEFSLRRVALRDDATVLHGTVPRAGCTRLEVVGGGLEVVAISAPRGRRPADVVRRLTVEARERSRC